LKSEPKDYRFGACGNADILAQSKRDTPNPVPRAVLSTTMCEDKKDLKERLIAIMKNKKSTRAAIVVSVVLIVGAVFAACALGAGSETSNNAIDLQAFSVNGYTLGMDGNTTPSDWFGNFDGQEMTIEQLKQAAEKYITMNRYLTITDLAEYKSINFSSDSTTYLMEYPTLEGGVSLSVSADATRIISRMSIRRAADNVWLGINADTLDKIENFITGAFTPEVVHPLWDVATPHKVQWSEGGYQFAWQHADNPMLAAVSSLQYLPTVHVDDKASLEAYAEAGDKFYDFKGLLDEYDEHFFDNNRLVLVYMEESMGSIQHQPLETTAENGVMMIPIERFGPGTTGTAGTADMLARFIFIECDKETTKEISEYRSYLSPGYLLVEEATKINDGPEPIVLSVKPESLSYEGLTVVLKNHLDKEVIYGDSYRVEKQENGTWVKLDVTDSMGFNAIGYALPAGDTKEQPIDWGQYYGKLERGHYRLIKDIVLSTASEPGGFKSAEYYVEFDITR
jgi:hypothetical protein